MQEKASSTYTSWFKRLWSLRAQLTLVLIPCMRVEELGFIEEFLKLIPNLLGLPKVDLWYMDPYVERQFGHQLDHSLSSTCFWLVIPIVAY